MNEPVLVYVEEGFAWFSAEKTWGDDWDDSPYWSNAGPPYRYDFKVGFDGGLETWDPWLSVDEMNEGVFPWLCDLYWHPEDAITVWGGATLDEFTEAVRASKGNIYVAHEGTHRTGTPDVSRSSLSVKVVGEGGLEPPTSRI